MHKDDLKSVDAPTAFKVCIALVLREHLLRDHEVKTTSSPDMISVTWACADHLAKAHEFVLEHVKFAFNVSTPSK